MSFINKLNLKNVTGDQTYYISGIDANGVIILQNPVVVDGSTNLNQCKILNTENIAVNEKGDVIIMQNAVPAKIPMAPIECNTVNAENTVLGKNGVISLPEECAIVPTQFGIGNGEITAPTENILLAEVSDETSLFEECYNPFQIKDGVVKHREIIENSVASRIGPFADNRPICECDTIKNFIATSDVRYLLSLLPDMAEMNVKQKTVFKNRVSQLVGRVIHGDTIALLASSK